MKLKSPWIESFIVGSLQMRCSVITDLKTGDTIIIDGGEESDRIISWIESFEGSGPNWSNGPKRCFEDISGGSRRSFWTKIRLFPKHSKNHPRHIRVILRLF